MRIVLSFAMCFGLFWKTAHSQTYVLTYDGGPLEAAPNNLPLPGATHIVIKYRLPAAYMPDPGGCANYNSAQGIAPSSYSDGTNSLASLVAAGYGLSSRIYFCLDPTGTVIVSWLVGMSGATGDRNPYNYFQVQSSHNYMGYPNPRDFVELGIGLPDGTYYEDSAKAGKWKVKLITQ